METHHSNQALEKKAAKFVYFYKDGDYNFGSVRLAVSKKKHPTIESLLTELSSKMSDLPNGVRQLRTPLGQHRVTDVNELVNGGKYICSSRESAMGMDVGRVQNHRPWRMAKPGSGNQAYMDMLKSNSPTKSMSSVLSPDSDQITHLRKTNTPKKVTVILNGAPSTRHVVLLNRRTAQTFEQVLNDLSAMFYMNVRRVYSIFGERIHSLSTLYHGPDTIIVAGNEPFKPTNPLPTPFIYPSTNSIASPGDGNNSVRRTQPANILQTQGNWSVKLKTADLSDAGSDAQIMLTVYGSRGRSVTLPLGVGGTGRHFRSGATDEFMVHIGKVGEIYKIRLSHDNSGESPEWLCDEVRMRDVDTGESLVFPCQRWLSEKHELGETTREIAAVRPGVVPLAVLHYEVRIMIGDVWNGGTTSPVYLTVYGDRGDSGRRRFSRPTFTKGQVQTVHFEAVCLGSLRKVKVGHDGCGTGSGMFLEKIEIKELSHSSDTYLFYCGRWLDEGEDDGKTFRTIHTCHEQYSDIVARKMWDAEKWKYENGVLLTLHSRATGMGVRFTADSVVDALAPPHDPQGVLQVTRKGGPICVLSSNAYPQTYLAIDKTNTIAKYSPGKGGKACELQIHVRPDRSILLESVRSPGQFVTFLTNGHPAVCASPSSRTTQFVAIPTETFCDGNIITLFTSLTQTLSHHHTDHTLTATGSRSPLAHFIVHTTTQENVYMFESFSFRGQFICMDAEVVTCSGDGTHESCMFTINIKPTDGHTTLSSFISPDSCIGMTDDGTVIPTPQSSVHNTRMWPEVVKYSKAGPRPSATDHDSPRHQTVGHESVPLRDVLSSASEISPQPIIGLPRERTSTPKDEVLPTVDYHVCVDLGDVIPNASQFDLYIAITGDHGTTGRRPVKQMLNNQQTFLPNQANMFVVSATNVGVISNVEIGHDNHNPGEGVYCRRVVVSEGVNQTRQTVFPCQGWLDAGQSDGLTHRQLVAIPDDTDIPIEPNTPDTVPVQNWEIRAERSDVSTASTLRSGSGPVSVAGRDSHVTSPDFGNDDDGIGHPQNENILPEVHSNNPGNHEDNREDNEDNQDDNPGIDEVDDDCSNEERDDENIQDENNAGIDEAGDDCGDEERDHENIPDDADEREQFTKSADGTENETDEVQPDNGEAPENTENKSEPEETPESDDDQHQQDQENEGDHPKQTDNSKPNTPTKTDNSVADANESQNEGDAEENEDGKDDLDGEGDKEDGDKEDGGDKKDDAKKREVDDGAAIRMLTGL